MKISNKLVLGTLLISSTLSANVTTLLPYVATLNYDRSANVSTKDKGALGGLYFSYGNLDYLFELDYAKTKIKYKNTALSDLVQDDVTVAYSRYFKTYFFKLGLHHVNTTDRDMGNGNVFIATAGTYKWVGVDKYTTALETYYSFYKDGFNDLGVKTKVSIFQISPSVTFSKVINSNTRNNIYIKFNYQKTDNYSQKSYTSYEIQDTLYYKNCFFNVKFIGGKMISGIRDGGDTVFNTKDVMKRSYGVKIGYYVNAHNILTLGYDVNNYREYRALFDGSYRVALLTYTYTF